MYVTTSNITIPTLCSTIVDNNKKNKFCQEPTSFATSHRIQHEGATPANDRGAQWTVFVVTIAQDCVKAPIIIWEAWGAVPVKCVSLEKLSGVKALVRKRSSAQLAARPRLLRFVASLLTSPLAGVTSNRELFSSRLIE